MSPGRPGAADNMHSFYDLPKINRHVDASNPWEKPETFNAKTDR